MRYDLVVIGGGPAGEKAAVAAAFFGKRVALVEASPAGPGGAAAHTGTLPSKTLRESALYLTGFRRRELYDMVREPLGDGRPLTATLTRRLATVRRLQTDQIRANLARHGVDLVQAHGSFVDPHGVRAGDRVLDAEHVLIATGSSPRRPPGFDFGDPEVFDSDTVLGLDRVPASLAIVGGGVIGSEYACVFAALGTTITLIESGSRLLSFLDREISDAIAAAMQRQGITVRFDDAVARIERCDDDLVLTLESGRTEVVDRVLVSAGRTGNTAGLNPSAAGVALDARGLVVVDRHFRSSQPNVFAAGDVIGRPALASASIEQGRMAVGEMFGLAFPERDWRALASGIYTIPEACACGPTEEELVSSGVPIVVGRTSIMDNARGQIIGDTDGFLKLIFHRDTTRLLATHLICERATELIHIGQAVMRLGGGLDYFLETVMTYPSLSDAYKQAAYDALGKLEGRSAGAVGHAG
ncbi:MAG: Si-specific NAD(P)(+) transhydrogenase [Acidobacteria bacterium]|nr:Si-specific NAD(P)(+) transhydrogenase [Acidobacteriota bacterium]